MNKSFFISKCFIKKSKSSNFPTKKKTFVHLLKACRNQNRHAAWVVMLSLSSPAVTIRTTRFKFNINIPLAYFMQIYSTVVTISFINTNVLLFIPSTVCVLCDVATEALSTFSRVSGVKITNLIIYGTAVCYISEYILPIHFRLILTWPSAIR